MIPENFVDADAAADFLGVSRRRVLDWARAGKIPFYVIDKDRKRKQRHFLLSELAKSITGKEPSSSDKENCGGTNQKNASGTNQNSSYTKPRKRG